MLSDFDASIVFAPALHWKWFWPENETTVNLGGAFAVIMLLYKRFTQVHSQKTP